MIQPDTVVDDLLRKRNPLYERVRAISSLERPGSARTAGSGWSSSPRTTSWCSTACVVEPGRETRSSVSTQSRPYARDDLGMLRQLGRFRPHEHHPRGTDASSDPYPGLTTSTRSNPSSRAGGTRRF
jgi:hypothetical protein